MENKEEDVAEATQSSAEVVISEEVMEAIVAVGGRSRQRHLEEARMTIKCRPFRHQRSPKETKEAQQATRRSIQNQNRSKGTCFHTFPFALFRRWINQRQFIHILSHTSMTQCANIQSSSNTALQKMGPSETNTQLSRPYSAPLRRMENSGSPECFPLQRAC